MNRPLANPAVCRFIPLCTALSHQNTKDVMQPKHNHLPIKLPKGLSRFLKQKFLFLFSYAFSGQTPMPYKHFHHIGMRKKISDSPQFLATLPRLSY
jgi:hypothetical protein